MAIKPTEYIDSSFLYDAIESELNFQKEKSHKDLELKILTEIREKSGAVTPFAKSQMNEAAKKIRIEKSKKDFWFWDKTYFPPELFSNYVSYGKFHKSIVGLTNLRNKTANIVMGPRLTAKTSLLKRKVIYDFLFGKRKYIGFGSGTLRTPQFFIADVYHFLNTNKRILNDFRIHWVKASERDGLHAIADCSESPNGSFIEPISEKRSTRGGARNLIDRYDLILITDIENETSPMSKDSVESRISRLNEMRTSLEDWGVLVAEGNNFSINTAMNKLKEEQEKGILSEHFNLHIYKAWDSSKQGKARSIWFNRFPAHSEEEMIKLMKPKDKYDWAGNYQQNPIVKGSDIFPPDFYAEWDFLPKDIQPIIYTDPNLSKKNKGDTTATGALGFSAMLQKFFVIKVICKSYSDTNNLLEDTLNIRSNLKSNGIIPRILAFDGNVSQESHWTQHVRNFSRLKKIPVPPIEYKKYKVDDITKNAELLYKSGDILFPPGFKNSDDGKVFTKQLFSFAGKKAGKKDDAPDWLICSIECLFESRIANYINSTAIDREYISISSRTINQVI